MEVQAIDGANVFAAPTLTRSLFVLQRQNMNDHGIGMGWKCEIRYTKIKNKERTTDFPAETILFKFKYININTYMQIVLLRAHLALRECLQPAAQLLLLLLVTASHLQSKYSKFLGVAAVRSRRSKIKRGADSNEANFFGRTVGQKYNVPVHSSTYVLTAGDVTIGGEPVSHQTRTSLLLY
eukprot:scaffold350_cov75-Skeletonema_dohrnii-CCMP3373.AAC.1